MRCDRNQQTNSVLGHWQLLVNEWACLTFTFQSLPEEAVQERSAVVTERRRHVIVDAESMGDVDLEPLTQILHHGTTKHTKDE
jgi:hypothetical protein